MALWYQANKCVFSSGCLDRVLRSPVEDLEDREALRPGTDQPHQEEAGSRVRYQRVAVLKELECWNGETRRTLSQKR